jgi:holliday junction DNA helicase RuvA
LIGRLTGRIARRHPHEILLDVAGVGYKVAIPLSTFMNLPPGDGEPAILEIYTLVRDDAILLYGFGTLGEKELFEALLSVSGVGPKVALAILSGLPPEEVARVVEAGDAAGLRAIPGVGRKLAERIVLELKDRIGKLGLRLAVGTSAPARALGDDEAHSALVNLGYAAAEARTAIDQARLEHPEAPLAVESVLRGALRILAR